MIVFLKNTVENISKSLGLIQLLTKIKMVTILIKMEKNVFFLNLEKIKLKTIYQQQLSTLF